VSAVLVFYIANGVCFCGKAETVNGSLLQDGYRDSRLPDFITPWPQRFFWKIGMLRTGNAFSTLRFWLWRLGGGTWGE
jgi:hypothetical protein